MHIPCYLLTTLLLRNLCLDGIGTNEFPYKFLRCQNTEQSKECIVCNHVTHTILNETTVSPGLMFGIIGYWIFIYGVTVWKLSVWVCVYMCAFVGVFPDYQFISSGKKKTVGESNSSSFTSSRLWSP